MRNPYRVTAPAIIQFSGGRTSAYMLWHILDANNGKLPSDVYVCFANTGREMPGTLDFISECGSRWGVHIVWLEYRRDPETERQWAEVVSHNSASRNGEPFEALLSARGYMLPGPKMRFCTEELKLRTTTRWVASELGWRWHRRYVGLRFDELHRVARIGRHNAAGRGHHGVCPLAKARVTKDGHITPFWQSQPFDLRLGGDWEGNCDGCFLKRISAIRRMCQDHPNRIKWWSDQEARAVERGYRHGRFRIDRPGFAQIAEDVRENPIFHAIREHDYGTDVFADCEGGECIA